MSNETRKEFTVDTAYQGYVFFGWASGMFESNTGRRLPYHNMFVFSPVSTYESESYKASVSRRRKRSASRRTYGMV